MVKMAIFPTKFSIRCVVCLRVVFVTHFISPQLYFASPIILVSFVGFLLSYIWVFVRQKLGMVPPSPRVILVCTAAHELPFALHIPASLAGVCHWCAAAHPPQQRWVTPPEGFSRSVWEEGVQKPTDYTAKELKSLTANFFSKYWSKLYRQQVFVFS